MEEHSVTNAELVARFTWVDYSVFCLMLLTSIGIGIYHGFVKKADNTKDFLMAGKSMSPFPVALSLIASFMSAITLLGTASEVYLNGITYWLIGFSYIFVGLATTLIYLPVFWELQLTSAHEYLELRFNKKVRRMGSVIFILQMTIYLAVVVYAPSLALSQVTGIGVYTSVCTICIVSILYTSLGGMKAVLWADTVQVSIMFGSMIFVLVKGAIDLGGFSVVWEANVRGERTELINFDLTPTARHTVWSLVIGGYFLWTYLYGCNQAQVQRYLCVSDKSKAIQAIALNCIGIALLMIICVGTGLVVYAKYETCDPISAGLVSQPDQLLPLFVMDTLGSWKGLPGVFVAGIFAGALSTVSAGINSLAAITLEDIVKPWLPDINEKRATFISKLLTLFYGIMTFMLVFVAEQLGNVLAAALGINGMVGGPLLGLFSLGMLFPWTNSIGAGVGTLCGMCMSFWIGVGYQVQVFTGAHTPHRLPMSTNGCSNFTQELPNANNLGVEEDVLAVYRVSYMWYSLVGCITVVVVGMTVSLLTGSSDLEDLDPRLLSPVFHRVKKYLPGGKRIRDIPKKCSEIEETSDENTYKLKAVKPENS